MDNQHSTQQQERQLAQKHADTLDHVCVCAYVCMLVLALIRSQMSDLA